MNRRDFLLDGGDTSGLHSVALQYVTLSGKIEPGVSAEGILGTARERRSGNFPALTFVPDCEASGRRTTSANDWGGNFGGELFCGCGV